MPPTILYAGLTDAGRVREANDDAFIIVPRGGLMVVADGLSCCQAGGVASKFVVENLARQIAMGHVVGIEGVCRAEQFLRNSLLTIAEQLHDMSCIKPEYEGMATTVVAGLVYGATLLVAHLGDSRAYRLRNGTLEQLTQDHNLGNALRDRGIVGSNAQDMPEYHTLRRFIGMDNPLPPDTAAFDLRDDDRLLLCSDGLTNMLGDKDIAGVLLCEISCEDACSRLVGLANQAGGYDNITAIVADVRAVDPQHGSGGGLKAGSSEAESRERSESDCPRQSIL